MLQVKDYLSNTEVLPEADFMGAGAPTKYKPQFCEQLIDHMAKGFSFESFAGVIRVSRAVLYNWEEAHPEFVDAKSIAKELNLLFWETQGIEGLHSITEYNDQGKPTKSKSINATVYIFNKKNRFPKEWRDRQEIDTKNENTHKVSPQDMALLSEYVKKEKQ